MTKTARQTVATHNKHGICKEANMLSLTIKDGDYLMIGDDIKITFQGNKSIGVDAPKSMKIMRGTLFEQGVAYKASMGDEAAIELNKQITANNEDQERDRIRKGIQAQQFRERRAKQKDKQMAGNV
jgi:sRNA-binding carbon storage regulator CsrA